MVTNMIVNLSGVSFKTEDESQVLAKLGVTLKNQRGADPAERDWIERTFDGKWPEEAVAGWNWFALNGAGEPVGFATYEQREHAWWWLNNWLDKPDVGIFGPTGVERRLRGRNLGCVLTRRALVSLQELGYARAIIAAVGPVKFYQRCCGASVAERFLLPIDL